MEIKSVSKVVTEHKGVKYSLQPHGLKSRLMTALAVFVVALGGAMLAASPAQAAVAPKFQTCADGWYAKPDLDEAAPVQTSEGFVFDDQSTTVATLAWHDVTPFPISGLSETGATPWSPVSLSGAPGANSAFKVITNPFATLNYQGNGNWWTSKGTVHTGTPTDLMADPYFGAGATVIAFGLGTAIADTDGPWTAKSVTFQTVSYPLGCVFPTASPTPTPVVTTSSSPTQVVVPPAVKKTTKAPNGKINPVVTLPDLSPALTVSPFPTVSPSPSPKPTSTPGGTQFLNIKPAGESSSGINPLFFWGIAVAVVSGLALFGMGVAGILKKRRRDGQDYEGTHHTDDNQTQMIPIVSADDHSVSDYHPDAGESSRGLDETVVQEPSPTGPDDTKPLPPVSENP